MLLCNSESCSAMLYYCWNPVLFNKNLLGMKQEMSDVCTVTAIRQSLSQLASSVSSPSSLSVTSCLVSCLVPRRSISGGGLRSATRPRTFPSGFQRLHPQRPDQRRGSRPEFPSGGRSAASRGRGKGD